ncbi:MAG TPA: MarP family serine protease [Acidimicrobiales bacterium]|jgi:S1-C subfamily serine protease
MSWIDVVIVVWVVLAAVRGRALGALAQLLGLIGLLVGLAIGSVIAVPIAGRLQAGVSRSIVTVCIVLGCAMLAALGGNQLGKWANVSMRRLHLGAIDAAGGAFVAAAGALLSAWLVAGLFTQSSVAWLAGPIQRSAVLTTLDAVMPPVPAVIARAQAFLSTAGFPVAFAGLTQPTTSSVGVPSQHAANLLAAASTRSVFKVVASGACGVLREGTAFVVSPHLVITNAHVVAGERSIVVESEGGSQTSAHVVLFDPTLDVAVLQDDALSAPALRLGGLAAVGTQAAAVGFPQGLPKTVTPAGIAGILTAQGRDIYGGGLVVRPIYAVSASVAPGNSGSPLVVDGTALGMVFSKSLSQDDLAYAIRSPALVRDVRRARSATSTVSTGACTPG